MSESDLIPCQSCGGYGDIHAGTRDAEYCDTCNGTGWLDGKPRDCPHCDKNVKPAELHVVYARAVWHDDCCRLASKDQRAVDVLLLRNDLLAAQAVAFRLKKLAQDWEVGPATTIGIMAKGLLSIETELGIMAQKSARIIKSLDPEWEG